MNYFSVIFFLIFIFKLQYCYSKSSYVFTQLNGNTFVCNSDENFCQDAIFIERYQNNLAMNMGFLNSPSEIFYNGYNMTEFGFPIFYKYFFDSKLKVNLIIANGKKTTLGTGKYYYVTLFDEDGECGEVRPKTQKDTVSGALYLNQRFAKYAYFLYQSSSTTCILSIKFKDLLQGNYGTDSPILIKPENGLIIQSQIKDYIYPFFTIDPIFGTMAFLIKDDREFAAIHYKIDENNLTNFEKVFSIPLPFSQAPWDYVYEFYNLIFKNSDNDFVDSKYPSFTSYGKVTYLFFAYASRGGGFRGIWSPKKQPASNLDKLRNDDFSRHLYFLDSDYFENGEPVGKFIPTVILTPYSAPESLESSSKCPEGTSYLGAFIAFAVIDFLLMLGLLGLGFLIWFGSKKMKKLRHLQNQRRGKKESSVYGVTSATTVAPTAQPSAVQPSAAVGSGASVAPTDLNTQVTTTTKKVTTYVQ